MAPPKTVTVSLSLPFVAVSGTWQPDDAERDAAWELYVELVTRVALTPLRPGEGMLREALDSLYALFDRTRDVLRRYGPGVARPAVDHGLSLGYIAVAVLNGAIRPVLASWHPELRSYEHARPDHVSPREHEASWELIRRFEMSSMR